jgi:hypothetical protein
MSGPPHHRLPNHNLVILTNGKDLLFARAGDRASIGKKQVLRYAQG